MRYQNIRYGNILRRRLRNGKLRQLRVLSLYDIIDLRNVNALIKSPQDPRQMLIHLQNHDVRLLQDPARDSRPAGQIKKAVPVHRRHTHHRHIDRQEMPVVGHQVPKDHGDIITQSAVRQLPLIG